MATIRYGVGYGVIALALVAAGCDRSIEKDHSGHSEHTANAGAVMEDDRQGGSHQRTDADSDPVLSGQYAFATISEIVALLESDPATDWSTVDLEQLRQHLIDMDRVTMDASVEAQNVQGGARFVVQGWDVRTQASIERMVSAHAETMAGDRAQSSMTTSVSEPWQYEAASIDKGMSLTVTASDEQGVSRIRGLGFIGVMALGDHHSLHHLALAMGKEPHHGNH